MAQILLRERVYIPRKDVSLRRVRKHFEHLVYDENTCRRCLELQHRHSAVCDTCPAFKGELRLWKRKLVNGKKYIAVPNGNPPKVEERLKVKLKKAKDLRPDIKFRSKLEFTGKLYKGQKIKGERKPNQRKLTRKWLEHKYGLIESPPRTGKTVMGVYLACKLRRRTLIVASQELWLRQFVRTFRDLTNARRIKAKKGRSPYILVDSKKKLKQIAKYDVVLLTYQKFIQLGQQKAFKKYIKGQFTLLVCDETHQGAATAYSRFLNNIDTKYKLGLTATPERVDGLHFVVEDVIGPVVARGRTTAMLPNIHLWESGVGAGKKWKTWQGMERFIYGNKARNVKILKQVFADLRSNPKASILTPVARVAHMKLLVKMINKQAAINNDKRDENWPEQLAQPFWSKMNRKATLRRIKTRKSRVTVAIVRMVQMGLDIPEWTHVYSGVRPGSSGPMFYQLACRVCTPYPKKKPPIVRMMIDPNQMSLGCFRKLWFNEIHPKLEGKDVRYRIDPRHQERAYEIAKYGKAYSIQDASKETKTSRLPF